MALDTEKLARLAAMAPGAEGGPRAATAPAYVYLLAEHLDAALAAGEDMLVHALSWNASDPRFADEARRERAARRETIAEVRTLELALVARVLRACEHAETLAANHATFRPLARLFLAGTVPLRDALADLGDPRRERFETGDMPIAYLRSRGLVDAEAAAPPAGAVIRIDEGFLVLRRVALGQLLDLAAMFLDTLELHFDLFEPEPVVNEAPDDLPEASMSLMEAIAAVSEGKAS